MVRPATLSLSLASAVAMVTVVAVVQHVTGAGVGGPKHAVVLLIDDLGYGDTGHMGAEYVATMRSSANYFCYASLVDTHGWRVPCMRARPLACQVLSAEYVCSTACTKFVCAGAL